MTVPTVSTLPDAPSRADDGTSFSTKADAFVAALPTFVSEVNAAAAYFSTQGMAAAAANFQGDYSAGTTYSVGQTVRYSSAFWMSLVNSNTGHTPSEGAWWTSAFPGVINNLSLGGTLTFQTTAWTMAANIVATRAVGTAPAGTSVAFEKDTTFSGNAGGTTDFRADVFTSTASGANNIAQFIGCNRRVEVQTTGGTTAFAATEQAHIRLGLSGSTPGLLTNAFVYHAHIANEGTTNIAFAAVFNAAGIDLLDGTGTVTESYAFHGGDPGHATRVTTTAAVFCATDITGGAAMSAGFLSQVSAGTGKYAFRSTGTAVSRLGGGLTIDTGGLTATGLLTEKIVSAGAVADVVLLQNPSASSVGTGVALHFDPNSQGTSRSASIKSRQTTSGTYADLGFFVSASATPIEAMTIATTGIVSFQYGISVADAKNIAFDTTTGSKVGTSASQKIGFWNATPVVQPSTTGTATGFTAGSGTAVKDDSTFTGGTGSKAYRISDIVLALKQAGLMATN